MTRSLFHRLPFVLLIAFSFTHRAAADEGGDMPFSSLASSAPASPPPSIHERLNLHLTHLDEGLTALRSDIRCRSTGGLAAELPAGPHALEFLRSARDFVAAARSDKSLQYMAAALDELARFLEGIEATCQTASRGEPLPAEKLADLQRARGFIKTLRRQLRAAQAPPAGEVELAEQPAAEGAGLKLEVRTTPALIIEPESEPAAAVSQLPRPLAVVLLNLLLLDQTQRIELARRIIDDDQTLVKKAAVMDDPNSADDLLHLLVERTVELSLGQERTLALPMKMTVERRNTQGLCNMLRLLGNCNPRAGVFIHTTLAEEVPVTADYSITAYEVHLAFLPGREGTEIRSTAYLELTFYGRVGNTFRDMAYRRLVSARSQAYLRQVRDDTLLRARQAMDELVACHLLSEAAASIPVAAANAGSETSPADPMTAAAP